jgi:hypothetical protein
MSTNTVKRCSGSSSRRPACSTIPGTAASNHRGALLLLLLLVLPTLLEVFWQWQQLLPDLSVVPCEVPLLKELQEPMLLQHSQQAISADPLCHRFAAAVCCCCKILLHEAVTLLQCPCCCCCILPTIRLWV